ncbi:hypothetical protein SSP24_06270 [Streptomyces spinoverrucosus]|uniref:DUF5063 domain-containing protein n=1 Tax=Streptomyces spinoverrucosus TaxID=284043 RepID=A0A4Y3V6W6_9ACTN|nr:hypothetical protein [Streptomyces spinoverrucosus]GEC02972.1 hypothetical protein SSP24_06270 [Streptomyces spinoverrucosus]GHB39182.1 hypothetical protein GCM10010397_06320 [Streptomyces spinoverrucosus]
MADHGDRERFLDLGETVLGMLGYLRELLLDLPIPVSLPDFVGEDGPNHEAVIALDRARHLIEEEPIPEMRQTAYGHLILEWLTAYEMLVLRQLAGPAPWRLDAAQFAIARFTTIAEMIENGELDDDES